MTYFGKELTRSSHTLVRSGLDRDQSSEFDEPRNGANQNSHMLSRFSDGVLIRLLASYCQTCFL